MSPHSTEVERRFDDGALYEVVLTAQGMSWRPRLVTSREYVSLQLQKQGGPCVYRGPFRRHLIEGSVTGLMAATNCQYL